jgi:hypothetical protein
MNFPKFQNPFKTHCTKLKKEFTEGNINSVDDLSNNLIFLGYEEDKRIKCLKELKKHYEESCSNLLTGDMPTIIPDEIRNNINPYCKNSDKKRRKEILKERGMNNMDDPKKQDENKTTWQAYAIIDDDNVSALDIINEYLEKHSDNKNNIERTKSEPINNTEKEVFDVNRSSSAPAELGVVKEIKDEQGNVVKRTVSIGGKKHKTKKHKKKGKKKTMRKKGKKKTKKRKGKKKMKKRGKKKTMKKRGKKSRK